MAERPESGPAGLRCPRAAAEAQWSRMDRSSLRETQRRCFRRSHRRVIPITTPRIIFRSKSGDTTYQYPMFLLRQIFCASVLHLFVCREKLS